MEDQLGCERDLEKLQTGSRPHFDNQTYNARLRQESAQKCILALQIKCLRLAQGREQDQVADQKHLEESLNP